MWGHISATPLLVDFTGHLNFTKNQCGVVLYQKISSIFANLDVLQTPKLYCNRKEESPMQESRSNDEGVKEFSNMEVNIYTDDCGEIQFHCLNDCLGGGAWLNIEY